MRGPTLRRDTRTPILDLDTTYVVWQGVASKQAYYVQRWDDALQKGHRPALNVLGDQPLAAVWPQDVFCIVFQDYLYKKPVLQDFLINPGQWTVVSGRLRAALEEAQVPDVEYLPIRVIDPTGLRLDETYSIVHALNGPDCLDLEASGAKRNRLLPQQAEKLERLVFKSDPNRPLFRPRSYPKVCLMRWDLAERLADQGFTGFRFMGVFDFGYPADLPPHPKRHKIDALCTRLWNNAQARG